jgi:hypothetical protein
MTMAENQYQPVATCDIPLPILETPPADTPGAVVLPRILLQAAGSRGAARKVMVLTAIFTLLSLFEAALFLRLPAADPQIVYHDLPRKILVEPGKP